MSKICPILLLVENMSRLKYVPSKKCPSKKCPSKKCPGAISIASNIDGNGNVGNQYGSNVVGISSDFLVMILT